MFAHSFSHEDSVALVGTSEHGSSWRPAREDVIAGAMLAIAFLVIYVLFLGPFASPRFPDFWRFGADSYRIAFSELHHRHDMALYQFRKHSLFVVIAAPVYQVVRSIAPCGWTTCQNLALTFPVALLGALNVAMAFLVFRRAGFPRGDALLPTVFYGTGLCVWVFSMFPDTPVLLCLLVNAFLFLFLGDPMVRRWRTLAVLNGLAGLAAPQLVLLGILPAAGILTAAPGSRPRQLARYVVLSSVVFLVPFFIVQLLVHGAAGPNARDLLFPARELGAWASLDHLLSPVDWLAVTGTFAVAAQAGVYLDPAGNVRLTAETVLQSLPALAAGGLGLVGYALWGWRSAQWRSPFRGIGPVVTFLVSYLVFFVCFSPQEAMLFAAPFLLPFWLLLHGGHARTNGNPRWRLIMTVMIVIGAIANGRYILKLARSTAGTRSVSWRQPRSPDQARTRFSRIAPLPGHAWLRPGADTMGDTWPC